MIIRILQILKFIDGIPVYVTVYVDFHLFVENKKAAERLQDVAVTLEFMVKNLSITTGAHKQVEAQANLGF